MYVLYRIVLYRLVSLRLLLPTSSSGPIANLLPPARNVSNKPRPDPSSRLEFPFPDSYTTSPSISPDVHFAESCASSAWTKPPRNATIRLSNWRLSNRDGSCHLIWIPPCARLAPNINPIHLNRKRRLQNKKGFPKYRRISRHITCILFYHTTFVVPTIPASTYYINKVLGTFYRGAGLDSRELFFIISIFFLIDFFIGDLSETGPAS
ncbi:hypothetical protein F5Y14DRAFT_165768 [Nemania sp. NC0429]|nr:hypothetical protein F5Y14DRAFT_165768 [Nemania sp. NC0429]